MYSNVKAQKKGSSSAGRLWSPIVIHSSPGSKANILKDQLSSGINVEDEDEIAEKESAPFGAVSGVESMSTR